MKGKLRIFYYMYIYFFKTVRRIKLHTNSKENFDDFLC